MDIAFTPVTATLGVQVDGLDLSQPLDEATVALLRGKLHRHGLLLFRRQEIDDAQQLRFALHFGRISKQGAVQAASPPVTFVSNVRADGTFGKGELGFHNDQTYYAHPMKAIMLYGLEVTARGGETLFVNTAEIVNSMSEEQRREFGALEVLHEFDYGALDYGDDKKKEVQALKVSAVHPVIAPHPWSDAKILMTNINAKSIVGVTPERSRDLLQRLAALVDDPKRIYRHVWQKGDLILWDNLLLQHARSDFDTAERRTLRRCAIGNENEEVTA